MRFKKTLSMVLVLSLLATAFSFSNALGGTEAYATTGNLLKNGDAEKGSLAGWKTSTKKWKATTGEGYGNTCVPYKGQYFFWAMDNYTDKVSMYQNVSVKSKYKERTAILTGYMAVWPQTPTDNARLSLSFYTSSGKLISTRYKTHKKAKWQKFTIMTKVPKTAKTMRVTLTGIRNNGEVDAYFDNIVLKIK